MEGGFAQSPLRLNEGLAKVEHWTEETILARAKRLAKLATEVWPSPMLDQETLKNYLPRESNQIYSIQDHPHLAAGPVRELFLEFRKQALALDQCVTEEFLKQYVAYKAESNFVDVVPQSRRLLLILNMPFAEIEIPKQICTDVTGRGKWGNGDIEVSLSAMEELPYVMGLVSQSFENQMEPAETNQVAIMSEPLNPRVYSKPKKRKENWVESCVPSFPRYFLCKDSSSGIRSKLGCCQLLMRCDRLAIMKPSMK